MAVILAGRVSAPGGGLAELWVTTDDSPSQVVIGYRFFNQTGERVRALIYRNGALDFDYTARLGEDVTRNLPNPRRAPLSQWDLRVQWPAP